MASRSFNSINRKIIMLKMRAAINCRHKVKIRIRQKLKQKQRLALITTDIIGEIYQRGYQYSKNVFQNESNISLYINELMA